MPDPPHTPDDPTLQADVRAIRGLMLRLSQATRRHLSRDLAAHGLTLPQYTALNVLKHRETGCTMSELAEAAYQVPATMTGIIDRLAERGLVARRAVPGDRRARHVVLTEAGRQMIEAIEQGRQAHIRGVLAAFTPHERQELQRLMSRYLDILQAAEHV